MTVIPGLYQLLIRLRRPMRIRVGALGECPFPAGWYVYTGSARAGLVQRVSRHLRPDKHLRWHIDYLLASADGVTAFVLPGMRVSECRLHADLFGGRLLIPGFGSSDCRCHSHLAHFRRRPQIELMPWTDFVRKQARRRPAV